ncbi:MAG: DNA-directed RNA polymerase [Desulfurococcaceae archaeon]
MYAILRIRDNVRIPPHKFSKPIREAALEELKAKYEGMLINVHKEEGPPLYGIIIAILEVDVNELGVLIPGDGASYHRVLFDALVFMPFIKEVVEGEVVSVTRSGLYVNLGPIDGFVHINQVADERVTFDTARGSLLLEESRRYVERGDIVRARVYTTGIQPGKGIRISMTMRQPGLGKLEWLSKERR